MKEKTFEELLTDDNDFAPANFTRNQVLKLLRQVREATIAECAEVAREHWTSPEFHINKLPTDRILTDK